MTAWLMSIVGITALGVLLEILLEDGETSKYVKGVFAIAVVLVIVAPLPKLLNKEWTFDSVFKMNEFSYDRQFVEEIESKLDDSKQEILVKKLEDEGIKVDDLIVYRTEQGEVCLVRCKIVSGDKSKCQSIIAEYYGIKREVVRLNGE